MGVGVLSRFFKLFRRRKWPVAPTNIKERFNLEGRMGQGSMSRVFRAYDRKLARTVCLKILDKVKTARFEDRFIGLQRPNEGMICTSLRHRNIVQTYEWGLTREREQFLVMELIDGMGLNFHIGTNHRQLEGNRINFLMQAAEGIAYIHDQGYIHRDICPRNIMITSQNVVKIIDFGLSIPNRPEFRRPGNRTGTANYMAPEIIKRVTTDHRVDLFALGVTAFETFTGNLPWEGAQSLETMRSHLNNPGRDPLDFKPDLDEKLAALLRKAIERDPNHRFQTAGEFRDALRALPKKDY
jgi:serine/threonine protein kinase